MVLHFDLRVLKIVIGSSSLKQQRITMTDLIAEARFLVDDLKFADTIFGDCLGYEGVQTEQP